MIRAALSVLFVAVAQSVALSSEDLALAEVNADEQALIDDQALSVEDLQAQIDADNNLTAEEKEKFWHIARSLIKTVAHHI